MVIISIALFCHGTSLRKRIWSREDLHPRRLCQSISIIATRPSCWLTSTTRVKVPACSVVMEKVFRFSLLLNILRTVCDVNYTTNILILIAVCIFSYSSKLSDSNSMMPLLSILFALYYLLLFIEPALAAHLN